MISNKIFTTKEKSLAEIGRNLATKWIGAIKTSIYIYVSPVITVILSVLILHEKITVISIIGTVLILIGLVISQKN